MLWLRVAITVLTVAVLAGAALAEASPAPSQHPELRRTYYDYGVAEYCSLVDMPVHNGFALLRNDQMAQGNVTRAEDRRARIDAYMTVDLEYQDRGLSGQKNWCRTEGAEAVRRFTVYFRTRHLP
jgi:hypothetical protein